MTVLVYPVYAEPFYFSSQNSSCSAVPRTLYLSGAFLCIYIILKFPSWKSSICYISRRLQWRKWVDSSPSTSQEAEVPSDHPSSPAPTAGELVSLASWSERSFPLHNIEMSQFKVDDMLHIQTSVMKKVSWLIALVVIEIEFRYRLEYVSPRCVNAGQAINFS